MLTIVSITIVALTIGSYLGLHSRTEFGAIPGGFIAGVFGFVCAVLITKIVDHNVPLVQATYGPSTLASLRTDSSISGVFAIGSGSIHTQSVYRILVQNDDGSMTPYSVPANESLKLIEDPDLKNKGLWTNVWLVPDEKSFYYKWTLFPQARLVSNEIRVPVGSVIQKFSAE